MDRNIKVIGRVLLFTSIFCKTKLGIKEYFYKNGKIKMTFHSTSLILILLSVFWLATLPTAPGSPEKKNISLFVTAQHREIV